MKALLLYIACILLQSDVTVQGIYLPVHVARPSYSGRGLREPLEEQLECRIKEATDLNLPSRGYGSIPSDGIDTCNVFFHSKKKENAKNNANNKKDKGRRNSKDALKSKEASKWGRSRLFEGMVFLARSMPYVVNKTHMTSVANFLYTSGGDVSDKVSRRMNTELTKVYRISNVCGKWLESLNNDIVSNIYRYDAACQTYEITKDIDAHFMSGEVSLSDALSMNSNSNNSYIEKVKTAHQLAQVQRNLYRSLVFRLRNIYSSTGPLARFDPRILDTSVSSNTNSTSWSSYKEKEVSARVQSMTSERSDFILHRFPSKVFLTGPQGGIGQHLLKEVYFLMAAKQDEERMRRRREYYWDAYGADMPLNGDSNTPYTTSMQPSEERTLSSSRTQDPQVEDSDHDNTERPVLVLATRPHKLPQLISNVAKLFHFHRDVRLIGIPLDLGCYKDMSIHTQDIRDRAHSNAHHHQHYTHHGYTEEGVDQEREEGDLLEREDSQLEREEAHQHHHTLFPGQDTDFDTMLQNAFDATPDSLDWVIQNAGVLPLNNLNKERNAHSAQQVTAMRRRNRRRIKRVLYDTPRALYLRCESMMNAQLNSTRVAALQKEEEVEGVLRATILANTPVPVRDAVRDAVRDVRLGVEKCREGAAFVGEKVKCFTVKVQQYIPQQPTKSKDNDGRDGKNSKGSKGMQKGGKGEKIEMFLFQGDFFNTPFTLPFAKKDTPPTNGKDSKNRGNSGNKRGKRIVEAKPSLFTSPLYVTSKNTTTRVGTFIITCSSSAIRLLCHNTVVYEACYLLKLATGKVDQSLQALTAKIGLAVPVKQVGKGVSKMREGMLYMLPMRGQRNESTTTKASTSGKRNSNRNDGNGDIDSGNATSWKENLDEMHILGRALLKARPRHVKQYLGFDLDLDDTGNSNDKDGKEKEEEGGLHLPFHLFHNEAHEHEIEESLFFERERARNNMDAVDRVRDVYSINALGPFALSLLMIPKLMLSELSNPCLVFVSSSSHLRVPYLNKWNIPDAFRREALLERCKIDKGNNDEKERRNGKQGQRDVSRGDGRRACTSPSPSSQRGRDYKWKRDVLDSNGFDDREERDTSTATLPSPPSSQDRGPVYPPPHAPAGDILPGLDNPSPGAGNDRGGESGEEREKREEAVEADPFLSRPRSSPPHDGSGDSRAQWERSSNLLISSRHAVPSDSSAHALPPPLEMIGYRSNLKKYVKRVIFGEEYIAPKPLPWYAPLSDMIDKYLPSNMFMNGPSIQALDWKEVERQKGLSRNKMFNKSRNRYFRRLKREEEERKRESKSKWWWPRKTSKSHKERDADTDHDSKNDDDDGSDDSSMWTIPPEQFVHRPNQGFARVFRGAYRGEEGVTSSTEPSKQHDHSTHNTNDNGNSGSDSPPLFNPAILTEGSKAYLANGRIWSSAQANTIIETQKNVTSLFRRLLMLDRTPKVYNVNKLPSTMETYGISKLHLVMAANALSTRFSISNVNDIDVYNSRELDGSYGYSKQSNGNKEKKELSPGSLWVRSTHPGLVDTPMLQSFFSNVNFPLRRRLFRSPGEGAASVLLSMLYPYHHLDKQKYRTPTGTTITSKGLLGLGPFMTAVGNTWQSMMKMQDQMMTKMSSLLVLSKLSKDDGHNGGSGSKANNGNNDGSNGNDRDQLKGNVVKTKEMNKMESKLSKSRNYFVDGKPGGKSRISPLVSSADNNDFVYAQMVTMLSPVLRKRIRDEALIASKILKHYSKSLPADGTNGTGSSSGYDDIRVREGQGLTKEIAMKRAILLQKFADEIIRIE